MLQLNQLYFVITRKCNLFCNHCIRSSGPGISDYLTAAQFREAVDKIFPYAQKAQILISGGEPTLHKDFVDICKIASEYFPKLMINTNGLRSKYLIKAYDFCGDKLRVQISIDGNEDEHDLIRGKGTFRRTIKSIERLHQHGIQVVIASTASQKNIAGMYDLDKVLNQIPYNLWTIKREVVYGRASLLQKQIDTVSWNRFVKDTKANFRNRERLSIATMFDWPTMSQNINRKIDRNMMNCGTGISKLYINPDLTVFPCGCLEQICLGDLSKDMPDKIVTALREKIQTKIQNPVCSICSFRSMCNGGCPGSSYNHFGQFGEGDPRCPAIQEFSNKLQVNHA